jgi:hypothetical protein
MSEPTSPPGHAPRHEAEEIRERVRELTNQLLQQGRINSRIVQDVVRAVAGAVAPDAGLRDPETRQAFADSLKGVDATLANSASAVHLALEHLAARGKDFSDNDIKDALLRLRSLQADCAAAVTRVAEAAGWGLRGDLADFTARAQSAGVDATASVASSMSAFANRVSENAVSGLEAARGASVRVALLTSGVLQGVADALREQAPEGRSK